MIDLAGKIALKDTQSPSRSHQLSLSYSASPRAHEPLHARMLAGLLFSRQVSLREQELLEDCKNPSHVVRKTVSLSSSLALQPLCPLFLDGLGFRISQSQEFHMILLTLVYECILPFLSLNHDHLNTCSHQCSSSPSDVLLFSPSSSFLLIGIRSATFWLCGS